MPPNDREKPVQRDNFTCSVMEPVFICDFRNSLAVAVRGLLLRDAGSYRIQLLSRIGTRHA